MIPSPDSQEKDVSELLAKCESSLSSRNFEEAISGCRAVLTIAPDNQKAKALMDEAQSKLEADLFARENLRKAQEFFKLRNFEKCINECQKVLLLDPDNADCTTLMNEAQQKREAEPFVQNFISSGRSLFDSGLYNEAIAQWEKVRSIDPNYPDLDRLVNNARQMMTMPAHQTVADEMSFDPATTEFQPPASSPQAAEEPSTFGFVSDDDRISQLLKEGDEHFEAGQYQKAIEVWSEIFMLDVNHPEALRKIEEARAAAGQQRVKLKDLLKSAQAAYESGNVDEARELFSQVRTQDPENSEAAKYLALIEKSEPSSVEDLIVHGDSAEQQGKYREAAQYFSQALAVDSENAQLAERIKNLNLLAKKQEQSKTLLGNARGFVAEGKLDSARHALGKILETDPSNQEALDLLRQIKESGGTSAASAPGTMRVSAPVVARKKFPVIPAAIGAGVLLIGGALWYFLSGNDEPAQPITPIKRTAVKRPNLAAAQPAAAGKTSGIPGQAPPPANESQVQKAERLVREADFYFHEKHYSDSLAKAEEAIQSDPSNKDAIGLKLQSQRMIDDQQASERKLLDDANTFFGASDFAGAVKLYEDYMDKHPESKETLRPQVIKCYYNLGVIAIHEWRCDTAADYFRQVLFIDETDQLSKDALALAKKCQANGTTDIEIRKAVQLMEMRR